ncbi:hypothetical protein AVEN_66152-1 [Araneus ventricosus]|uniref:Uncharacterized protein n=1 Tax=Araneus ventricosus TaxID=182803 RepID=A0A4Y2MJ58_ARAVE|nr:hypothetical protein AVEN_66152-1 [Araneus ventricosus]
MSQRRRSNRKTVYSERDHYNLEPWLQREIERKSHNVSNVKGGSRSFSRTAQNTPPKHKNEDLRPSSGNPERTNYRTCRDATVNGVPGFYTPEGLFIPYQPTPSLELNTGLPSQKSAKKQQNSSFQTPEPSPKRYFQKQHHPAIPLDSPNFPIQESPSNKDSQTAPVSPHRESSTSEPSIFKSPVLTQPIDSNQKAVQTPSTDNDYTIIYYSTPTSAKSVPNSSSESTPSPKKAPFMT